MAIVQGRVRGGRGAAVLVIALVGACFDPHVAPCAIVGTAGCTPDGGGVDRADARVGASCPSGRFCELVDDFSGSALDESRWSTSGGSSCEFEVAGGRLVLRTEGGYCKVSSVASYELDAEGIEFFVSGVAPAEFLAEVGIEQLPADHWAGFELRTTTVTAVLHRSGSSTGTRRSVTGRAPPYRVRLRRASENLRWEFAAPGETTYELVREEALPEWTDSATAYVVLGGDAPSAYELEVDGVNTPP